MQQQKQLPDVMSGMLRREGESLSRFGGVTNKGQTQEFAAPPACGMAKHRAANSTISSAVALGLCWETEIV